MLGQNYWSRLKDSTGSMDVSQVTYVMSAEPVKKVYKEMMVAFNSFLFEKFKEDFSAVPAFQPVVDKYIDCVINTAKEYGKHAEQLEEENKRLKKLLEELQNANRPEAE